MTSHVFIVDSITFKYHLEYLFAGTGSKDDFIDFNNKPTSNLPYSTENKLMSMIADSQRIRKGDLIYFYLQQNYSNKIYEGKFYGIFKAKQDLSFLDNNDSVNFLKKYLVKSLTFRTLIEPFEVYSKGVTEWEALDEIKSIQSPYQMLWSLIYRKLRANRGNTMITIYESERLYKLLRDKNNHTSLSGRYFSFDNASQEIYVVSNNYKYTGRQEPINILPRLIRKYNEKKAFETHLQAYIIQNIGRSENPKLDKYLLGDYKIEWLGNEVYCGVGMQKIDILISLEDKKSSRIIVPIELKSTEIKDDCIYQIQRYIDWLVQYYVPNRISDISPVIISKKITNKNTNNYLKVIDGFRYFNSKNPDCLPIKYIEYEIDKESILFQNVEY